MRLRKCSTQKSADQKESLLLTSNTDLSLRKIKLIFKLKMHLGDHVLGVQMNWAE